MSCKWLTTHAPSVAALTLALTLGGVGAAAATSTDACPSPAQTSNSSTHVTRLAYDTGSDADSGTTHTVSPATWYPPA
ncbi:hypothetical protein [Actinacidiphila sp. bgisy145]|uniref:hypothetical protein n=1 Tax=Actinacidiphila sp. bgisy145 TaxID=3413792 RepID=UPI003EB960AA